MNRSAVETAQAFYAAFQNKDAAGMGALYADDATFHDPGFGLLQAADARKMWRMLLKRGKDLTLTFTVQPGPTPDIAITEWIATYTFSQTGRKVRNVIRAEMQVKDGLIRRHVDSFDLWAWSRQALGMPGLLLGWTPMWPGMLQKKTRGTLAAYEG
jgi:ketosteroid isomerase-like protein